MTRYRITTMVLVAVGLSMLTGCASIFTGHSEADQATRVVLDNLDPDAARIANERYEKLAPHFENFGVVNAEIYRGAQPDLDQLGRLVDAGIVTVVDFRDQMDKVAAETEVCGDVGLQYFSLPWSGKEEVIDLDRVARFLSIVTDPANLPAFVHCKRGAERTGTMLAVYRIEHDDWLADRAYAEMNQYRFRPVWFGNLKRFVLEYEKGMVAER